MTVGWLKEQDDLTLHLKQYCGATTMSTSTSDDSAKLINWSGMLDAGIATRVKECLSGTCDTDMLTEPYHRSFDDIATVDADDAARICAVDVAAASPTGWLINLPLN